ncbi:hypothetical protein [Ruegeria atlantica]|uniref:hypothetical protein n=1 Tax=Ruegeria atlantica TaxID=81569 RepID=UPI00147D7BEF|nr:hypothetical protein [Ruegeria atlantica]
MSDYSAHEALHTAYVLMDSYGSYVGEHPWVEANPEIAAKVETAMEAMMEVYQAIGRVHLVDDSN